MPEVISNFNTDCIILGYILQNLTLFVFTSLYSPSKLLLGLLLGCLLFSLFVFLVILPYILFLKMIFYVLIFMLHGSPSMYF